MHSGGAIVRWMQPVNQVALRADSVGTSHVAFLET